MNWDIFGKKITIKTEFVVISAAVLILVGCLAVWLISRDGSGILIDAEAAPGSPAVTNQSMNAAGDTGGNTGPECKAAAEGKGKAGIEGTAAMEAVAGTTAAGSLQASPGNTVDGSTGSAIAAEGDIKVYVVGCVNSPGIVVLKRGDVIYDAVEKAGGLSKDADASSINMVYKLNGNTMLHIKSKKEIESGATPSKSAGRTGIPVEDAFPGTGAELIEGSGSSAELSAGDSGNAAGNGKAGGSGNGAAGEDEKGTVNINTADISALDKLPGVGEATAREIIAYREKNGPFRKIEDIMKVPRIKQGRFDSIKDLIRVE